MKSAVSFFVSLKHKAINPRGEAPYIQNYREAIQYKHFSRSEVASERENNYGKLQTHVTG